MRVVLGVNGRSGRNPERGCWIHRFDACHLQSGAGGASESHTGYYCVLPDTNRRFLAFLGWG